MTTGDLLERLCSGPADATLAPSVALIVAHPDDEVIGAGAQLPRWRVVAVVHITDGSPRDLRDARSAGYASSEAYAAASFTRP